MNHALLVLQYILVVFHVFFQYVVAPCHDRTLLI